MAWSGGFWPWPYRAPHRGYSGWEGTTGVGPLVRAPDTLHRSGFDSARDPRSGHCPVVHFHATEPAAIGGGHPGRFLCAGEQRDLQRAGHRRAGHRLFHCGQQQPRTGCRGDPFHGQCGAGRQPLVLLRQRGTEYRLGPRPAVAERPGDPGPFRAGVRLHPHRRGDQLPVRVRIRGIPPVRLQPVQ